MRILYLTGPYPNDAILSYLRAHEESVTVWSDDMHSLMADVLLADFDAVAACNYKHIVPSLALAVMPPTRVNCHISYLPWNRGSQPNYWSWREQTEKGVSLVRIDKGVDTGPLYAQRRVQFGEGETLATSHARLHAEIYRLFVDQWPVIKSGQAMTVPQVGRGSFHDRAAFEAVKHTLTDGWHTPVSALVREKVTA